MYNLFGISGCPHVHAPASRCEKNKYLSSLLTSTDLVEESPPIWKGASGSMQQTKCQILTADALTTLCSSWSDFHFPMESISYHFLICNWWAPQIEIFSCSNRALSFPCPCCHQFFLLFLKIPQILWFLNSPKSAYWLWSGVFIEHWWT